MALRRAMAFSFMAALVAALNCLMVSPTLLPPACWTSSSRDSAKGPMVEPLLTASSSCSNGRKFCLSASALQVLCRIQNQSQLLGGPKYDIH